MQSACHTHSIFLVSLILDFLDTQFSSNCGFYICSPLALEFCNAIEKILCAVLGNTSGQFWDYAPLKVVPFFWTTQYIAYLIGYFFEKCLAQWPSMVELFTPTHNCNQVIVFSIITLVIFNDISTLPHVFENQDSPAILSSLEQFFLLRF